MRTAAYKIHLLSPACRDSITEDEVTDILVPSTNSEYHMAEVLKKNHHFLKAGSLKEPQERKAALEVKYLPRVLSRMSWKRKKPTKSKKHQNR